MRRASGREARQHGLAVERTQTPDSRQSLLSPDYGVLWPPRPVASATCGLRDIQAADAGRSRTVTAHTSRRATDDTCPATAAVCEIGFVVTKSTVLVNLRCPYSTPTSLLVHCSLFTSQPHLDPTVTPHTTASEARDEVHTGRPAPARA